MIFSRSKQEFSLKKFFINLYYLNPLLTREITKILQKTPKTAKLKKGYTILKIKGIKKNIRKN